MRVDLTGVPETALWTLYHRALEAGGRDPVLDDPLAVDLVERIDYPFAERFGDGRGFRQWQALRAATFDREVRRFAAACPGGTVVALGEGFETGFWRAGELDVEWLTVELPEMIELRDRLLPASPRRHSWAGSALDHGWMDEVDPGRGVLVTAQGLLMYFARADAHGLIAACAERLSRPRGLATASLAGGAMVFDAAPAWLAGRELPEQAGFRPPRWEWGMDPAEERALASLPGVAVLRVLTPPRGRGVQGLVLPLASRVGALRRLMLSIFGVRFTTR